MPPQRKDCPVPGCVYTTPTALSTYDLVYRDIELHTQYAHSDIRPALPQLVEQVTVAPRQTNYRDLMSVRGQQTHIGYTSVI